MALSDTSPKARVVYFQALAGMTPAERLRVGVSLWEAGDAQQKAQVRRRNPEADETEILFQIAVARFGAELARAAYKKT